MIRWLVLSLLVLTVSGCVQPVVNSRLVDLTIEDAKSAALVADASKDLLPPGDVWGACMNFIGSGIVKLQAGPGLKTPVNGPLTEAMRLHVLRALSQNIPADAKAGCGQMIIEILLDAGQRAPGL